MYLNRAAFLNLLDQDIEWLLKQPATLEREHIIEVLRMQAKLYVGGGEYKHHICERLDP